MCLLVASFMRKFSIVKKSRMCALCWHETYQFNLINNKPYCSPESIDDYMVSCYDIVMGLELEDLGSELVECQSGRMGLS